MTFTPAQWATIMANREAHGTTHAQARVVVVPAYMLPKVTETPIQPHGNESEAPA